MLPMLDMLTDRIEGRSVRAGVDVSGLGDSEGADCDGWGIWLAPSWISCIGCCCTGCLLTQSAFWESQTEVGSTGCAGQWSGGGCHWALVYFPGVWKAWKMAAGLWIACSVMAGTGEAGIEMLRNAIGVVAVAGRYVDTLHGSRPHQGLHPGGLEVGGWYGGTGHWAAWAALRWCTHSSCTSLDRLLECAGQNLWQEQAAHFAVLLLVEACWKAVRAGQISSCCLRWGQAQSWYLLWLTLGQNSVGAELGIILAMGMGLPWAEERDVILFSLIETRGFGILLSTMKGCRKLSWVMTQLSQSLCSLVPDPDFCCLLGVFHIVYTGNRTTLQG